MFRKAQIACALGAVASAFGCAGGYGDPLEAPPSMASQYLKDNSAVTLRDELIDTIISLTTADNASTRIEHVDVDGNGEVHPTSGAEIVFMHISGATRTTIKSPRNVPILFLVGQEGGAELTVDDGDRPTPAPLSPEVPNPIPWPTSVRTPASRVIVGSTGSDKISVLDSRSTHIVLGGGGSEVTTGTGGQDTVEASTGTASIVGGEDGSTIVKLGGTAQAYTINVANGHAIVSDNASHAQFNISKIQYVQLDNGNAMVFANDSVEAAVAALYRVAFGRDADAGGLDYWFDLGRAGVSLIQIANAFTHVAEFAPQAAKSDLDFVEGLYQNTFGRAGEDSGVAYWTDALTHGASRAELIQSFAEIAVENTNQHQEIQPVGSITIVPGIL